MEENVLANYLFNFKDNYICLYYRNIFLVNFITMIDTCCKIYNFLKWKRVVFFASVFLFLMSCVIMMIRGFSWGLEFTGGVLIAITTEQDVDIVNIHNILIKSGYKKAVVQYINSYKDIIVRLPLGTHVNQIDQNIKNNIMYVLRQGILQKFLIKQVNWVGPSVSSQLINTGIIALLIALICILIYITFRFEWRLAIGVVISLIHDIIIVLGMLSLLAVEIDTTIIAALMSVIGYSINDKIVIFDRIRENFYRLPIVEPIVIFNISLSQVLNRTIITSMTTIVVLFVLLILGGVMLQGFAITLILGSMIGTVSSIYVASALALELGTTRDHFRRNK